MQRDEADLPGVTDMSSQTLPEQEASCTTDLNLPPALGVDAEGRVHCHRPWTDKVLVIKDGEIVLRVDCREEHVAEWLAHVADICGWTDQWADERLTAAAEQRRLTAALEASR